LPLPAWAGCARRLFDQYQLDAQGAWTSRSARFDLRYEFIDQDQPMSGDSRVGVARSPATIDEVRTINRNWDRHARLRVQPAARRLKVSLPVVDRSHDHIHRTTVEPVSENWNFTEAGIPGYWTLPRWRVRRGGQGLLLGVKLPTGSFKSGERRWRAAERTLQPAPAPLTRC